MIRTYKLFLRSEDSESEMVLRIYDPSQKERVDREQFVLQHLYDNGYPVPKILKYKILDDTPVVLHEFIEGSLLGHVILQMGYTSETLDLIKKYAEYIYKLHQIQVPGEIMPSLDPRAYYQSRLKGTRNRLTQLRLDFILPVMDWLDNKLSEIKFDTFCLIHKDFHANNIIVSGKNLVIIDWFDAHAADFREELGWISDVMYAWDHVQGWNQIQDGYGKHVGEIMDLDFFEVLNLVRRFSDVLLVVREDDKAFKVKEEAKAGILANKAAELRFHQRLVELTNIEITEYINIFEE